MKQYLVSKINFINIVLSPLPDINTNNGEGEMFNDYSFCKW